jgi:hypothetical protein
LEEASNFPFSNPTFAKFFAFSRSIFVPIEEYAMRWFGRKNRTENFATMVGIELMGRKECRLVDSFSCLGDGLAERNA